jgi:glycosyltransferase involved in cell wall biosynthesis
MEHTCTVSIILPVFNRARFLAQAMESIRLQTLRDWELIIVDDGSTDATAEILPELMATVEQPVKIVRQENQGAYGARNTGLQSVSGKYVAFYDSDDYWLPHHLQDCVDAMESDATIDWVYGACQIVNEATGVVLAENTFYEQSKPRPFLRLRTRTSGNLRVIDDPDALKVMISYGLFSGLQNSVLRSELFSSAQFEWEQRNEAEDQLFVIRALMAGRQLAYFDNVHVIYRVHADNSSAAGGAQNLPRQRRVLQLQIEGYERLYADHAWPPDVSHALRRRLGNDYFWKLGYSTLLPLQERSEAIAVLRRGLRHWPWNWRFWKTYLIETVRYGFWSLKQSLGKRRR